MLIFNMLNLKTGHFIQMNMSRLMLQLRPAVQKRGQPTLKMLFWKGVLVAKIAEATGWVSMPDLH